MEFKSGGADAPITGVGLRRRQTLALGLGVLAGFGLSQKRAVAGNNGKTNAALGEWASDWDAQLDPSLFLVSEKLDGVRAIWDGAVLRFRSGRTIAAPEWFLRALPAQALDGELWLDRKRFDPLSGAVRKVRPVDAEWRALRYMVFDAPAPDAVFEARAQRLQTVVERASLPWLIALEQTRLATAAGVQARLQQVAALGGEGLMLHRMDAPWQPGRSEAVRKLKLQPDDEARVVAHIEGKGKFEGQMGALLLEMPSGQRFALGTGFSAADRANPPPIGAQVTYRYRDRTPKGLPKFASYLRVRGAE
jgi:DNA ligase-1